MKDFFISLTIATPPVEVFNAITKVKGWWVKSAEEIGVAVPTTFEGHSEKLNDEFTWRHGDVHYSKQKLVEVIPGKKMVWLVTDSKLTWIKKDQHEWTGTKMIFELTPQGNSTLLHFTHQGLVPELECYEHCIPFWNRVIKEWLLNFINNC
jgi:uncharacterized protein YndB with AHSA1/START domain